MKVTGQLKEPVLAPCPNRDDLQTLVDERCQPVQCDRPRDAPHPGLDCCQYWAGPDQWKEDKVRVDQIDPEKFEYEQYRYQLYAKPADHDCSHGVSKLERVPDRHYEPPVTDIRALRQSTVVPMMHGGGSGIPVVPSNPGGMPEVTFPMTHATLGQPDVTTACCVPVVPCQQGYQNLTSHVKQGARCQQPPAPGRPLQQLGTLRPDPCSDTQGCKPQHRLKQNGGQHGGPHGGHAPQYVMPPSNQQGTCCGGLPPVFAQNQQAYGAPNVQGIHPPHAEFQGEGQGQGYAQMECLDKESYCVVTNIQDGLNPRGGSDSTCTNVKTFRYPDRVMRDFYSMQETPQERRQRLTRMSGAYGAALQPKQSGRRGLEGPKNNIVLQGNGFSWGGYPKHENRQCYVLKRNSRC